MINQSKQSKLRYHNQMKNSFCILQLWEGMTVLPKVWYVGIFFFLKKKVRLHICRDVIYWHLTPRPSAINLILPKLNCGLGLADKHNVFSKNVIDSISYAFSFLGNGREPTDFSLGYKTYTLPYGAFLCWHLFPRL